MDQGTRRRRAAHTIRITTSGSPATVAVPLTAPLNMNTAAENSAALLGSSRPVIASTIGSATHGSTAVGRTSALRTPTCARMRGARPYDMPATHAAHGRHPHRPGQAAQPLGRDHDHQHRPDALGHPRRHLRRVREQEEGPLREQVAVRLVLQLAEVGDRVPEGERLVQEGPGPLDQRGLGVVGRPAELLEEREGENHDVDEDGSPCLGAHSWAAHVADERIRCRPAVWETSRRGRRQATHRVAGRGWADDGRRHRGDEPRDVRLHPARRTSARAQGVRRVRRGDRTAARGRRADARAADDRGETGGGQPRPRRRDRAGAAASDATGPRGCWPGCACC